MLLRTLPDLFSNPSEYLILLPVLLGTVGGSLLIGITVHEFSHAVIANALGDQTAKRLGRISLNPIAHLDPAGTVMLLLVGFGWGKPVPVNIRALRNGRSDMAIVSLAGPTANLMTAIVCAIPLRSGLLPIVPLYRPIFNIAGVTEFLGYFVGLLLFYNLILAIFNLLPLAPLDGSKVAIGLLPAKISYQFARLEAYGPGILMLIIFMDLFLGTGILSSILFPMLDTLIVVLVGVPLF